MAGNRKRKISWMMGQRPGYPTKVKDVLKVLACHIDPDVERIQVAWKPRFLHALVLRFPGFSSVECLDRSPVGPRVTGMLNRLKSKKRIVRLRGCHWNLSEIAENQWMLIEQDWHRLLGLLLLARIKPSLLQS
ncbi:MAG: hypothetical protein WCS43_12895 [Verrucomicrobiota bacterium]